MEKALCARMQSTVVLMSTYNDDVIMLMVINDDYIMMSVIIMTQQYI